MEEERLNTRRLPDNPLRKDLKHGRLLANARGKELQPTNNMVKVANVNYFVIETKKLFKSGESAEAMIYIYI